MQTRILIKPLISEKNSKLAEVQNQYCFVVAKGANKIEIKKAVQDHYNVTVVDVNTALMPATAKTVSRKGKAAFGFQPGFKKAFVKLQPGDIIDFLGVGASSFEEE